MSQLRTSQHIKYKKEVWEHTSNEKQLIQLWWITSGMIFIDQHPVSDCLTEQKSRAPPSPRASRRMLHQPLLLPLLSLMNGPVSQPSSARLESCL